MNAPEPKLVLKAGMSDDEMKSVLFEHHKSLKQWMRDIRFKNASGRARNAIRNMRFEIKDCAEVMEDAGTGFRGLAVALEGIKQG